MTRTEIRAPTGEHGRCLVEDGGGGLIEPATPSLHAELLL